MFSDKQLIQWNREGWFPGPHEKEQEFYQRVQIGKNFFYNPEKSSLPQWANHRVYPSRYNWVLAHLHSLFDIIPEEIYVFFSKKSLRAFEGGAFWTLSMEKSHVPLVQLHETLQKKSLYGIYSLEEILSHELIHACRLGFEDHSIEEFFAYMSSSSAFRKIFGPLFSSPREVGVFFIILGIVLLCSWVSPFSIFTLWAHMLFLGASGFFLWRLFYRRWKWNRCYKKFCALFKDPSKARAMMFRLSKREMEEFSRLSREEIVATVTSRAKVNYRWKIIVLAYFS
ncbi:MAG: hypothetical protein JW769_03490 [Parachlamydiales bacterium]|nr:hypothetical protein [Parachlamydiales bacterium]